jgi:hypothetical protein
VKKDILAAPDDEIGCLVGDIVRGLKGTRSADSIRRDIDRGLLPATRTASGVRIAKKRDADAYIAERTIA